MLHPSNFGINELKNNSKAKFVIWFKMLIRKSMHRKNKRFANKLAPRNILDGNPFWLEMSATWTRKTEELKYGAQFQCITVEIKERFEHTESASLTSDQTSDRPSFHKPHQRAQVAKSLSSVKLPMSGFSLNLD